VWRPSAELGLGHRHAEFAGDVAQLFDGSQLDSAEQHD
jgi:hypothetical protein